MRHLIPVPPPHVEGGLPEGVTFMGFFAAVGAVTVAIIVLALLWHAARWLGRRLAMWLSERTEGLMWLRSEVNSWKQIASDRHAKIDRQASEISALQQKVRRLEAERTAAQMQVERLESQSMAGRYAYLVRQLESNVPLRNDGRLRAVGEFAHELLKGLENQP